MIKDSPIVEDSDSQQNLREIRSDIDRYIAYLQREAAARQAKKAVQQSDSGENSVPDAENHKQTDKETRAD